MANGRSELVSAHKDPQAAYDDLSETIAQMKEVRDTIPGMFDEAEQNYLAAIDEEADTIQATYQQTLNTGFKEHGCLRCDLRHNWSLAAHPLSRESP